MTVQAAALVLFLLTFAALGALGVAAQWQFFRKYTSLVPGETVSDDDLADQFFENPFQLARRGPSVVTSRLDILFKSNQDVELERLRRRCLALFAAAAVWMVVGLPATFVLAAFALWVARPLGPLPGLVIIVAWIGNLAWGAHRGRLGAGFVIAAIVGIYVGSLLSIGALATN